MFQYEYRPGDVSRKHNDRTIFPCRHSREFSECGSIYHIGEALNIGLMGYNGVLCAIALGGKSWMSLYGLYVPFYSLLYCKLWE